MHHGFYQISYLLDYKSTLVGHCPMSFSLINLSLRYKIFTENARSNEFEMLPRLDMLKTPPLPTLSKLLPHLDVLKVPHISHYHGYIYSVFPYSYYSELIDGLHNKGRDIRAIFEKLYP